MRGMEFEDYFDQLDGPLISSTPASIGSLGWWLLWKAATTKTALPLNAFIPVPAQVFAFSHVTLTTKLGGRYHHYPYFVYTKGMWGLNWLTNWHRHLRLSKWPPHLSPLPCDPQTVCFSELSPSGSSVVCSGAKHRSAPPTHQPGSAWAVVVMELCFQSDDQGIKCTFQLG